MHWPAEGEGTNPRDPLLSEGTQKAEIIHLREALEGMG